MLPEEHNNEVHEHEIRPMPPKFCEDVVVLKKKNYEELLSKIQLLEAENKRLKEENEFFKNDIKYRKQHVLDVNKELAYRAFHSTNKKVQEAYQAASDLLIPF